MILWIYVFFFRFSLSCCVPMKKIIELNSLKESMCLTHCWRTLGTARFLSKAANKRAWCTGQSSLSFARWQLSPFMSKMEHVNNNQVSQDKLSFMTFCALEKWQTVSLQADPSAASILLFTQGQKHFWLMSSSTTIHVQAIEENIVFV